MVEKDTLTDPYTKTEDTQEFDADPMPALLVAYAPSDTLMVDYFLLSSSSLFTIGRRTKQNCLASNDRKISKYHAKISPESDRFVLEDLGSTNGTYVNGSQIRHRHILADSDLIRVGHTLLVFHADARALLKPLRPNRYGIAGQFHVMPLLRELEEAQVSKRHILLSGPTGSGKELAAQALAKMMNRRPLVVHNAAKFTSEDEAASSLFGVAKRVFSSVDARPGLIEQSDSGVLFLDEVHILPSRIQKSLLRIIEDGNLSRIGDTKVYRVDVRFVFASNVESPTFGLASDMLARLRVVHIPPLSQRVADIPSIFNHLLCDMLERHQLGGNIFAHSINGPQYEALCLDQFPENNVRGLLDVVDRLVSRVKIGTTAPQTVQEIFTERFPKKRPFERSFIRPRQLDEEHGEFDFKDTIPDATPRGALLGDSQSDSVRSRYEKNKSIIIQAYEECGGVINSTCRMLNEKGIKTNPRWLSIFLDRWGVRKQLKK